MHALGFEIAAFGGRRGDQGAPLLDQVVDVEQAERRGGIVDADRQAARQVVAEGGDAGVVVGPRPFAEDVGQPPDHRRRRARGGQLQQEVLAGALGAPIVGALACLARRGIDHQRAPPAPGDGLRHGPREGGAAGEFRRIRWPHRPRQVEDHVRVRQCVEGLVLRAGAGDGMDLVAQLLQPDHEVAADEAGGPGDRDDRALRAHRARRRPGRP